MLGQAKASAAAGTGPALPLPKGTGGEEDLLREANPADPRALALSQFAEPQLRPLDRFIHLAYRLGIPGSALAAPLRGPAPLRLLATVENPLAGDKAAGMALRAGHFRIHGLKLPITQLDFAATTRLAPPLAQVVHGFGWLADLEAAGPRPTTAPVAERITQAWLAANPTPPPRALKIGPWSIGNAGARLMAWLVHAPLVLASTDKAPRRRLLGTISETARWLDRQIGRAEDSLGAVSGWAAITAAGLLLPDGRPRRIFGEAGLVRALGELLGDDGGVLSRSPLAQMEAIAVLARLNACYRATRHSPPAALEAAQALMVPPLLGLMHGDGGLGNWQGSWAVSADAVARVVAASGVRARPLRDARQWGYQRATAGKTVLVFDAAPPPLARHARCGCASTLAFELSDAGQRLIVNCGGAAAAGGLMPARLEMGLRATAAHSTVTLDDTNSTAVLINGKLGRGVGAVDVDRRTVSGERSEGRAANGARRGQWQASRLEASHDGYAARYGLVHRRILMLRDDGSELRGEDVLVPVRKGGKRGFVGYAIRFHLGPDIEVALAADARGARLAMADGRAWQLRVGAGEIAVDDSLWADAEGRPVPVQQLVIQGMVSRGGGNFSWILKRMN